MTLDSSMALGDDVERPRPRTILYVEDHADTLHIMGRLLRSQGYTVLTANTFGRAEEEASAATHLDVLVADIKLPDGDGLDLLKILQRDWPDLCGICLSGFGMQADIEQSRCAGFAAHLIKPIDFKMLTDAVHRICHAPPTSS